MNCLKCKNEIEIKLGTKIDCKGCKILTEIISIITVQCDKCNHVFQIPISSKSFFSVKKDK